MKRKYFWPITIICSVVLISLALSGVSRLWGQNVDTESPSDESSESFVFQLYLDSDLVAIYDECFGLGSSNDIEENTIVTDDGVTVIQKTPGILQWHNITLKRIGLSGLSNPSVWQWRKAMEDGDPNQAIRDGTIVMSRSDTSELLARWFFHRGWVSSLSFDGSIEELTIVHEGVERLTPNIPTPWWAE
jgi:hypothetical protein